MHDPTSPAQATASLTYPFQDARRPGRRARSPPACCGCACRCPWPGSTISTSGRSRTGAAGRWWTPACRRRRPPAHWQSAFAGPLRSRTVMRVICTHMHPDHIGMAGWLTRQHDCRLWTTRLEYVTCRMLVADTGREAPPDGVHFYRAAGWDEDGARSIQGALRRIRQGGVCTAGQLPAHRRRRGARASAAGCGGR